MKVKECMYCGLASKCPLKCRPVEDLTLSSVLADNMIGRDVFNVFGCENLVMLYQKFQEIGKYIEEEKEKCLGKVD